jgi:hypothetical protein
VFGPGLLRAAKLEMHVKQTIAAKVKQEFAAKEKVQAAKKTAAKAKPVRKVKAA